MKDLHTNLLEEAKREGIERIVVGAIIFEGKKVLLLQRPRDDFMGGIDELPSGVLEEGETIQQGLKREILEETNIHTKSIGRYIGHFDYLSGSGKKTRQLNFLVEPSRPYEIRLTEHDSYKWANPSEMNQYNITESVRKIIASL